MVTFETIDAKELGARMRRDRHWKIIDVRTPAEFAAVHLEGATNIPTNELSSDSLRQLHGESSDTLYVLCQSGGRSRKACQSLTEAGVRVVNVDGGTTACVAAGLPVVRGRGVIGLDRQVRIAAGSLVLIGIAGGWWLNPAWLGLSAFVGAGLVFAGVTDTCGMAMVLAAMPWNRVKGCGT
jgi:rhodanese-related sulfurtransferase